MGKTSKAKTRCQSRASFWAPILLMGWLVLWGGVISIALPSGRPVIPFQGADPVWFTPSLLIAWIPSAGAILFLGFQLCRTQKFSYLILGLLTLLAIIQVALPLPDIVRLATPWPRHDTLYWSDREYVALGSRKPLWPDPRACDVFDLGREIRLAMPTTCFANAERKTLPVIPAFDGNITLPLVPPHPASPRELDNWVVCAKAIGYLRYFNPSDQNSHVRWDHIARWSMQAVADASDADDLAKRLDACFRPLAPNARFLVGTQKPLPLVVPPDARYLVRWRHSGLGNDAFRPEGDMDRSSRLAGVALTWNVFQHFYPYFDQIHEDWDAALREALAGAAMDQDHSGYLHTLRRLVAMARDGHIYVPDPNDQFHPAVAVTLVDDRPLISLAFADAANIPLGSEVMTVDGEPARVRMMRMRKEISAATEGWMRNRLEETFLTGPIGALRLEFREPSGRKGFRILQRAARECPRIHPYSSPSAELRPGVWILDLSRLDQEEFRDRLPRLLEAKAIIFDLRRYPEHFFSPEEILSRLSNRLVQSSHWMVPLITQPNHTNWSMNVRGRWRIPPARVGFRGKNVFLIGGGTISYGESLMGIVEAYRLGTIIGEPTAGTNGNICNFDIPGFRDLPFTGMRVLKNDGSPHHGVGIHPHILVMPTAKGVVEGRDEVLDKALAFLAEAKTGEG